MARMRKVTVVVLGTAAAFSPSPSSSALLPTQIALRAAEAPEDAAPPTEEGPDAAAVAAGATAATAAGATMLSAAGTACADICGKACASEEDSWAAYCVMDAFANLEETCAGTYDAQPPARRLGDEKSKEKKPVIDEDEVNWTQSCGTHAICTGCDDMKNEGCRAIFEELQSFIGLPDLDEFRAKIAYGIEMGTMGEPKPSVAAIAHWSLLPMMLEPEYLMPACENMGYAYAPRPGFDGSV